MQRGVHTHAQQSKVRAAADGRSRGILSVYWYITVDLCALNSHPFLSLLANLELSRLGGRDDGAHDHSLGEAGVTVEVEQKLK